MIYIERMQLNNFNNCKIWSCWKNGISQGEMASKSRLTAKYHFVSNVLNVIQKKQHKNGIMLHIKTYDMEAVFMSKEKKYMTHETKMVFAYNMKIIETLWKDIKGDLGRNNVR